MFKLMGKKIITILSSKNVCIWTYGVDIEGESEWPRTLYASALLLENFQLLFFFLQKDPTSEWAG